MGMIKITDYTASCSDTSDGLKIYDVIAKELGTSTSIEISFKDIINVTTSFVNVALIPLLEQYSFQEIKEKIRFSDTNSQINKMIRDRFIFVAQNIEAKKNNANLH